MAPTKTVRSKFARNKPENSQGSRKSSSGPNGIKKSRPSKGVKSSALPKQQKTKPTARLAKRKRLVYTEKELGLPKLNTITPVGVDLPKGKRKGKIFVDDQVREVYRKEERKDSIRRKRKHKPEGNFTSDPPQRREPRPQVPKTGKKRVSFA
ncbi:MAG: hypothetical protein Q9213_000092 [Squamulea squamosa]